MATRMQQRRGTAAQWISTNSGNGPILNAGEIGYETDTNKFKIGDGTNHWINLDYFIDANSTANPSFGTSEGTWDENYSLDYSNDGQEVFVFDAEFNEKGKFTKDQINDKLIQ